MQKLLSVQLLKIFSIVLLFISSNQLWAAWGPDSEHFKEEASLVGTWVGALDGKPFESAIWPNQSADSLTGVMIWGSCTARVSVEALETNSEKFLEISKTNPLQLAQLFSFSRTPIKTEKIQSECSDNENGDFYFETIDDVKNLQAYTENANNSFTREQKRLQRGTPSRYLNEAIEYLVKSDEQYALTTLSKDAINNPARNYLASTTTFPTEDLNDIENKYYVSELGGIYQIGEVNRGKLGQYFFYLKVVDLGPHNSTVTFSVGDNGGSGEFNSSTQTMLFSLYDQSEQCGQIRKPATEAKVILDSLPLVSTSTKNDLNTAPTWALQSKGICTSYEFYGRCNPKQCTRWFRDQINNQKIKAILTESLEIAKAQAKLNSSSIILQ